MVFDEKLELSQIAGFAIQIMEQMGEMYLAAGQADPILYNSLRVMGELADQYKERAIDDEASEEVVETIGEIANQIHLHAMEAGEICRRIIEENGLPMDLLEQKIDFDGEEE